jgi:release factor glutamine methyltransferase
MILSRNYPPVTNLIDYLPAGWKMMTNKAGGKPLGLALDELITRLEKTSDTPSLDAQALLACVMRSPRSWIMAHPEEPLSPRKASTLERMAVRLEHGDPLPYVLGRWEFFGLEFEVTREVLIPRPETELMVERAISWLWAHPDRRHVIDVGTGSGCIGIALAFNVSDAQVVATDISAKALELARRNAISNGVAQRIKFLHLDMVPPRVEFDLIVANLPYIPTKTLQKLPIFGREPTLALDGGADGLDLIHRLLTVAPERLVPGGLLLMEIEASEGSSALSLACDAFGSAEIHLHKDLSGRDRILEVQV